MQAFSPFCITVQLVVLKVSRSGNGEPTNKKEVTCVSQKTSLATMELQYHIAFAPRYRQLIFYSEKKRI